MAFLADTVAQTFVWMRGDLLVSAALTMLLLGPGAACCWFGYYVAGVRFTAAGTRAWTVRRRRHGADRIEQRLESICTALSILTDSTEAGLRETIGGLERLAGPATAGAAAQPAPPVPQPIATATAERGVVPQVAAAGLWDRRTAREIAIAEGVSEGEVQLRLRLQRRTVPAGTSIASGQTAYVN